MSSDYRESLPNDAAIRYDTKLAFCGLDACPYSMKSENWTENLKQWPPVNLTDKMFVSACSIFLNTLQLMLDNPSKYLKKINVRMLQIFENSPIFGCCSFIYHTSCFGSMIIILFDMKYNIMRIIMVQETLSHLY